MFLPPCFPQWEKIWLFSAHDNIGADTRGYLTGIKELNSKTSPGFMKTKHWSTLYLLSFRSLNNNLAKFWANPQAFLMYTLDTSVPLLWHPSIACETWQVLLLSLFRMVFLSKTPIMSNFLLVRGLPIWLQPTNKDRLRDTVLWFPFGQILQAYRRKTITHSAQKGSMLSHTHRVITGKTK